MPDPLLAVFSTLLFVTTILAMQFALCTLAALAFAHTRFPGSGALFALVLVQLMVMPGILMVENDRTMRELGIVDTILAIGLPYMASAFGIFLLRQAFRQVPRELGDTATVEGCGTGACSRASMDLLRGRPALPTASPRFPATGTTVSGCS